MIAALIAAVLSAPLSVGVVVAYLTRRDAADRQERADLAQRFQAPETAVAQHFMQTRPPAEVAHLPFDDDGAWAAYQQGTNE